MSAVPDSERSEQIVRLRAMCESDLTAIMEIEQSAYRFPWSRGIFRDCIRVGYCCQVLEEQEQILAYGIMSAVLDEAHILNLCVRPTLQKRGLARQMLEHLCALAQRDGAQTLFLEVRPSNQAALRLYTAAGFCELGRRRDYYPAEQGREDALLMARTLL